MFCVLKSVPERLGGGLDMQGGVSSVGREDEDTERFCKKML